MLVCGQVRVEPVKTCELTVWGGPPPWGLKDQSTLILLVGLLEELKLQDRGTTSPLDACRSAGVDTEMEAAGDTAAAEGGSRMTTGE